MGTHRGQRSPDSELPQEIWLYIFRLAATSPRCNEDSDLDYSPFLAIPWHDRDWTNLQKSLDIKRTLVLVCKAWRALTMELLYENIRIRSGSHALREGLERSGKELGVDGYGRWTRRIEIAPMIFDIDPFNPTALPGILQQCPRTEVLVRSYGVPAGNHPLCMARFETGVYFPQLTCLKRLDWWLGFCTHGTDKGYGFLGQVLEASPNLRYLTLGSGSALWNDTRRMGSAPITIPSLIALRLECDDARLLDGLLKWRLPKLTHLILDSVECLSNVLRVFGSQLSVVELHSRARVPSSNFLKHVFHHCPNIEGLNYRLHFNLPAVSLSTPQHKLRYFRLNIGSNSPRSSSPSATWLDPKFWTLIEGHFAMISGPYLPALEQVILHGDWDPITRDHRFHSIRERLRNRNCALNLSNGTPVH